MKTDNANLPSKLQLRRYFLDRYSYSNIFDCCQGNGIIWQTLCNEYNPSLYMGVDLKSKKGRLKIDSVRILNQSGWKYDVVDIDTYGSPFKHFSAIIKFANHDITIFLTIGNQGGLSRTDSKLISLIGIDQFSMKVPPLLITKFSDLLIKHAICNAKFHGWQIIEAMESQASKHARYIGIRLKKLHR